MTERDWLACNEPEVMLECLREKASPRKLRLFAVAALRRVPALLAERGGHDAAGVAERYADGQAAETELRRFWNPELNAPVFPGNAVTFEDAYAAAFFASVFGTGRVSHFTGTFSHRRPPELAAQAALLRDLFGNPFDTLTIKPSLLSWNDGVIPCLAQAAYDDRHLPEGYLDPGSLSVLADALEESGADAGLVGHLRGPGHVRGCHVIDALRGVA